MAYRVLDWKTVKERQLFEQASDGSDISTEVATLSMLKGQGDEIDLHRLFEDMNALEARLAPTNVSASAFEAWVGTVLHEHLRTETDAANERGFWLWLSLGPLREIIAARSSYPGSAFTEALVGLGPAREGFLYRAFLRADLVFDSSAPPGQQYRHAFVGDQDFWRSHVIRLGYGITREQLHAFVEFLYPGLKGDPLLASGTHELGVRLFVKRLRRVASTTSFVFLDRSTWVKLLEKQASTVQWELFSALNDGKQEDARRRSMFESLHRDGVIQDLQELSVNGRTEAFRVLTACVTRDGKPYQPKLGAT